MRLRFEYNGRDTTWGGNLKTFTLYPADKQAAVLNKLASLTRSERVAVRSGMAISDSWMAKEMMEFVTEENSDKPNAEVSIVACLLAVKRKDMCAICLSEMSDISNMVVATNCKHVFCRDCILQWVRKKQICPKCRGSTDKALIHLSEAHIAIVQEILSPEVIDITGESALGLTQDAARNTGIREKNRVTRTLNIF